MDITSNKCLQLEEIRVTTKPTSFLERARPLARLGIRVFPCDVRGKEPVMLGYGGRLSPLKNATQHEEIIVERWGGAEFSDCNVGCFFPRAVENNFVIDVDSLSACERILGHPLTRSGVAEVQSSTPDKRHLYFSGKVPDWFWAFNADYNEENGQKHELFSVRNKNRYVVGPGSVHPSGVSYRWVTEEPKELPPLNETLLRELQLIAEKRGLQKPNPLIDGDPMPVDQYEAWVENLRSNLEQIMPEYDIEERTSQRHGGIEFVIRPCPLGPHDSGNNTGLITVAPSGQIGWNCFHSSHTMPWKEARKIIEDQSGANFTFPSGPQVVISGDNSIPDEEARVELPPDSVSRLEIARADYIDFLAQELTDGTKLPFSFARETLKLMLLAALPKKRPTLPWFHTLHCRQYVVLVSDKPGTGKGETWRRARATMEKAEGAFRLEFINGDSLGSPQWACVALGGERQSAKKLNITVKKRKPEEKEKSGIHIEIGPNGRIVFYDEGRKLFQQDSVGKQERGLLTMFTSLFESNQHATGSFSNGAAEVNDANVSLMLHFTRDGFDKCFTGSGATRDGFLSRCCIVSDYGNEAPPDWKLVNRARVRELVEGLRGCLTRTELPEQEDAKEARHEYLRFLQRQDPLYASRLQFLFTQDLYVRALFAPQGCITVDTVRRAIAWTGHQLLTRQALWPMDTSSDKYERMYHALRAAYRKNKTLSLSDARKFGNVGRPGSGGITVFNQVHSNMLRAGELEVAGMNRKNKPRFRWAGD